MISLEFKNKNNCLIIFDKEKLEQKKVIFDRICESISKIKEFDFIININALDNTIESFIEEINSNSFLYINKYKNKIFLKELPELFYFSKNKNDLLIFKNYIFSSNEGIITLYFIEPSKLTINNTVEKERILSYIDENKILSINIISDGDVFEIKRYKDNIFLETIVDEIKIEIKSQKHI